MAERIDPTLFRFRTIAFAKNCLHERVRMARRALGYTCSSNTQSCSPDENRGMLGPAVRRAKAALRGVVRELVVGKVRAGDDVGSHVRKLL